MNVVASQEIMYIIELTIRLNTTPILVHRRELADVETLYQQIRQAMETGSPRIIHLVCQKNKDKKMCVVTSEILAIQLHELEIVKENTAKRRAGFQI